MYKTSIATHLFFQQNIFHFEEWLRYHIDFGIDHFYIYEGTHKDIPCLTKDVKRNIKIEKVSNISQKDVYDFYLKIRDKYKGMITFIKFLPKSNYEFFINSPETAYEQNWAIRHFYTNLACNSKYTFFIDTDEFLNSNRYVNFHEVLKDNELRNFRAYYLRSQFLDSLLHNIGKERVSHKTKGLKDYFEIGRKFLLNTNSINNLKIINPHSAPIKKDTQEFLDEDILHFRHFKLNPVSKFNIEKMTGSKEYEIVDLEPLSSVGFVDCDFIQPRFSENFKDEWHDYIGFDFKWDMFISNNVQ